MRSPCRTYRRFCWVALCAAIAATSFGQVIDQSGVLAKVAIQSPLDLAVFRQTLAKSDLLPTMQQALASGVTCKQFDFVEIAPYARQQRLYRATAWLEGTTAAAIVQTYYFHTGHPQLIGDSVTSSKLQSSGSGSAWSSRPFIATIQELAHLRTVFLSKDAAVNNALTALARGPGLIGLTMRSGSVQGQSTQVLMGVYGRVNGHPNRLFWVSGNYDAAGQLQGTLQIVP